MALPAFLPENYSYVAAALVSTIWLTFFQTWNVERKRWAAKIEYPQMYAEKAEAAASQAAHAFNCAQRAHLNTLEWLPQLYLSTLFVGLEYPIYAASMCGFWTVSRIVYTIRYSTGDANKRINVITVLGNMCAIFGLSMFGATYVVYVWLRA